MNAMSRVVGVTTLLGALWLVALPPAERAIGQPIQGATDSAKRLRRDLGEKGQIVIESLDLDNADIENVVRFLARIAGINVITGDLSGAITVYLENVTVQDALEAILASQGYGFIFDGNIVRVVDASQLGEDRVETITETFVLNYLPAQKVADTLKSVFQGGGLGGATYSQIEANVEANAIIAVDIPRKMEDIRRLVRFLDQRFEQVEIEGRFIEISYSQDQQWGVDWRFFTDPANTFDVNLAPQPLNANNVAGQFKFAVINGDTNFTGFIQMLESQNDIKVLASPKILAIENEEAEIALINEEPFVEANVSQGVITESVQFQETGIRLLVTPTVAQEAAGTYVTMNLDLEQRIRGPNVVLQNSIAFPVDSRRAVTTLVVPDNSTVIIGGLKSDDLQYTYDKVPFFGNVPLLGAAFRRRAKADVQRELVLFVTPRVIYDHPPLDMLEQERHDDVDRSMDALARQSEWRQRVEAPITMIDKGILYSNEVRNPDTYDRIEQVNDCIEGVKPYKISKPKGERRIQVMGDASGVKETYEYVDDGAGEAPSTDLGTAEVRDFSIIEKEAGKAEGSSAAGWNRPERREAMEEAETAPASPTPAPQPAVEPKSDTPSWLRRGARNTSRDRSSDAGEIEDGFDWSVDPEEAFAYFSEEEIAPEAGRFSKAELDELLTEAKNVQQAAAVASKPSSAQAALALPEEAPIQEAETFVAETVAKSVYESPPETQNPWGLATELTAETAPLQLEEPLASNPWKPADSRTPQKSQPASVQAPMESTPSLPLGGALVPSQPASSQPARAEPRPASLPARPPERIILTETLTQPPQAPPAQTQPSAPRPIPQEYPHTTPVQTNPPVDKVDLRASSLGLSGPPETDFRKLLDPEILASMEQLSQNERSADRAVGAPQTRIVDPYSVAQSVDPWEVRPGGNEETVPSTGPNGNQLIAHFAADTASPNAPQAQQTAPRIEVPASPFAPQPQRWWRRVLGQN